MYDYSLLLTYKLIDDDGEDQKLLYQIQLLQLFNMNNYDEDLLNKNIDEIYLSLKDETFIKEFIKSSPLHDTLDEDSIFRTFFSFQNLDKFQRCLFEFYTESIVSSQTINEFKTHIIK
jgi:hypothetical protein